MWHGRLGPLARRVLIASGLSWALVVIAFVLLVTVRDRFNGCHEPHNQPGSIGGTVALVALAVGLVVVAIAMVSAVRARRRERSLRGFWAAYVLVAVQPLAAGSLFAFWLRDTFTFCF